MESTNRIVNLIETTIRNIGAAESIEQYQALEKQLNGLVEAATAQGQSMWGLVEETDRRIGASSQDIIAQKKAELEAAQQTASDEIEWLDMEAAAIGRVAEAEANRARKVIQPGAGTEAAIKAFDEEAAAANGATQAEVENAEAVNAVVKAHIDLADVAGLTVRQYAALTEAQLQEAVSLAKQGVSLQDIALIVGNGTITIGQFRQAFADLGIQIEKTTQAGDSYTQGVGSQIREARSMRYGGLELMAVFSMMSLAIGETLPASFREMEKSAMLITSGGLATAMMGAGAGVGLLVGAVVAAGTALFTVDEATQNLNKSLDSLAKKDELISTLSAVLGVTKSDAQSMEDLARKSGDAAIALNDLAKAKETPSIGQAIVDIITQPEIARTAGANMREELIQGFTQGDFGAMTQAVADALSPGDAFARAMKSISAAKAEAAQSAFDYIRSELDVNAVLTRQQEVIKNLNSEQTKLWQEQTRSYDDYVKAWTTGTRQMDDAWATYLSNRNKMIRDQGVAMDALNYQHDVVQHQQNLDAAARIDQQYNDAKANAWQSYQNTLADNEISLNDKMADYRSSLNDKLLDLEHNYSDSVKSINDQIARNAEALSDKLYNIEQDRIYKSEDLSFSTAQSLANAKTEKEVAEINFRANYERSKIERNASDARRDALDKAAQDQSALEQKKRDTDEEYAYRKSVAEREYNQELEKAIRTYDESRDKAQRTFDQQTAAATRSFEQQTNALTHQIELQDQAYHKQVEDKKKADAAALNDLYLNYVKTYDKIKEKIDQAYNDMLAKEQELSRDLVILLNEIQTARFLNPVVGGASQFIGTGYSNISGYRAEGGEVYGGKSYIVGEKGPEILHLPVGTNGTVTPMDQSSKGSASIVIYGNIYGVDDLEYEIQAALDSWDRRGRYAT